MKIENNYNTSIDEKVKMFLFSRWIATCYADSHLDSQMRCEHDEGFNPEDAISVLNRETGYWYKKQMDYFLKEVYPNYQKNGSVENAREFFKNSNRRRIKK